MNFIKKIGNVMSNVGTKVALGVFGVGLAGYIIYDKFVKHNGKNPADNSVDDEELPDLPEDDSQE